MAGNAELLRNDLQYIWHPLTQSAQAPDPIVIRSAKGAVLHSVDGREFIDLISSWWVTGHGHAHPAIANAIAEQAKKLEQVIFADFTHEPAIHLAATISHLLPGDLERVFFSDNGSTAMEVALKQAYQYWRNKKEPQRTRFLTFENAYHGDTVGAMSLGRDSGFSNTWSDLLFHVDSMPFPHTWQNDEDVLAKETRALQFLDEYLAQHTKTIAAVLLEPLVQGAAGMRMCRPQFLQQVSEKVQQAGALLVFDEIMTGFGRTGKMFACEHIQAVPDIVCLSKALTGGFLPLSVTVCKPFIFDAFVSFDFEKTFMHSHSFTANPISCAAALASIQLFKTENTLQRVAAIETHHQKRMDEIAQHPHAEKIRVLGNIAAFDIATKDAGYHSAIGPKLKQFFYEKNLLLRPLGNTVYLIPPYCISTEQLDQAYDAICEFLARY